MTLRDDAEAFAIGLEVGFIDVLEVQAWVDEVVAQPGPLPPAFIDLIDPALRSPLDWLPRLRAVEGTLHPEAVQRKIAVRLLQMLEASPAEESAATLRSLRLVGALPSDLETRLDWASEELFLVAEGTVAGSDGDVIESLRVDLERLVDTM